MVLSRIVIPSFIMSEAGRVKESMLHVIEKYQAKVIAVAAARAGDNGAVVDEPKKEATSEFNASEYLFVSSRIARSFPNLKASGLVQDNGSQYGTLFAALLYYQSIRIAMFRHEQDATTPLEQPSVEEEENTSERDDDTSEPRWRSVSQCTKSAQLLLRLTKEHWTIQHVRDMVKAHVREVGEMSNSDDEEKETPRYRLAEVLHRPSMMEKLFDLGWGQCPDTSVSLGGDFATGGHDGGAAGSE
jgi:hypothetical protein